MIPALWLMGAIIAVGAVYVLLPVVTDTLRRFRGRRTVICPETGKPASVRLDATRAAATSVFGTPDLRLTECDRWPERRDCDRECVRQIGGIL